MNLAEQTHYLIRAWRSRLRGDKFGIGFLLEHELQGMTAVDVGANRGSHTWWLHKQVAPTGKVIAFEPQPELAAYLRDVRDTFHLDRLEVVNSGLSSAPSERQLHRPIHHWGGASLESQTGEEVEVLTVDVTTLDGYLAKHPSQPVGFIKCDVEGHELGVFQGAQRVLGEDRPDILLECEHADDPKCPVILFLKEMGYEGYCFYRGGYVPIARYVPMLDRLHKKARLNFAFVPEEHAGRLKIIQDRSTGTVPCGCCRQSAA